jgi:NAD+ diphosphatase
MTYTQKWYQFCPHCKSELKTEGDYRAWCEKCGFDFYHNPAPCVSVIILNQDHTQTLLAKRAINPEKGKWDVVGGFIDQQEIVEDALIRETKEETGLDVKIIKYLGNFPDIYGNLLQHTLVFTYLVEIVSGEPTPQDDVAELKWFDLDKIPYDQIPFQSARSALKLLSPLPLPPKLS